MLSPPTHQSGPAQPHSGLPAVQAHATVTRTAGDVDEFEACAQNSTVTGSSSVVPSPPTHQPSSPQTHHIDDDTRTGHSVVVGELGDACTQNSSFNPRDVVKNDAVWSTVEALQLMDDTSASQHNFLDILQFGKNLYKRGLEASYTLYVRSYPR